MIVNLKRCLSIFLAVMLLIGIIPAAYAVESGADSTQPEKTVSEGTDSIDPTEPTEPTEPPDIANPQDDYAVMSVGSTQKSIMLFDYADNGNYTTVLKSQVSCEYKPNRTGAARTAYIKNLGWHFARYGGVAYPDEPLYCIEPWRNYGASTSGNSVDRGVTLDGSGSTTGSNVWYAMPEDYRETIGLILLYSDQMWDHSVSVTTTKKDSNPNVPLRIATQFLIYEIVCGLRDPATFKSNSVNVCGTSGDIFYNAGEASVPYFAPKYNALVDAIQATKKIPSFTGASVRSAPTITLTGEETSVTDSKHNGTNDITDGYAHTGTASDGDVVDYQIVSTLPSITSASTYLTCYTFADTLSRGITYNKHDVVLEFFTDAACTDPVAKWAETDGKFTVTYSSTDTGESGMTIEMTADGLKEMNTAVYSDASMVNSGYSDCTLRITYAATVNSSADVVYGDNGNPNEVVLTWKRTSQDSYDTLKDDARVFTYGLELTKLFSDGKGDFSKVQFIMQNKTDGYYVKARLDEATGVYYVTDHVADKKDATRFVPTVKDGKGKILIKGLEDDEYTVTEIKTADGYTLLKKGIAVVISRKDASASAAVDGKQAAMLADNGSANALVPLSVVNTSGFDLPATGDRGVWMYGLAGILLMTASAACIIIARKRFK